MIAEVINLQIVQFTIDMVRMNKLIVNSRHCED